MTRHWRFLVPALVALGFTHPCLAQTPSLDNPTPTIIAGLHAELDKHPGSFGNDQDNLVRRNLNNDPGARAYGTEISIAEFYEDLGIYDIAKYWYTLALQRAPAMDAASPLPFMREGGYEKLPRDRISELDPLIARQAQEEADAADRARADQASRARFEPTLHRRKEIGQYVCNESWGGYVERISGDRIQVRVHHDFPFEPRNNYDEMVWVRFDQVGICGG